MKNKTLLFVVSVLTVALMLLASCGPKAPASPTPSPAPTAAPAPTPSPSPSPTPAPSAAPAAPPVSALTEKPEKPKSGGTINILMPTIPLVLEPWDAAAVPQGMGLATGLVFEQAVGNDWAKGLAGTGEIDWGSGYTRLDAQGAQLAESWEVPSLGTWIFKIRKGARFGLNPASEASKLVNGREFTVDDYIYNVRRFHTDPDFPLASVRRSQPAMAKSLTVEKTGPSEATVKVPVDPWQATFWVVTGGNSLHMFAPEVIKKYGNALEWQNAVGTGPYMVTDVVQGSFGTFVRNPNYWEKNPVGPGKGDQLPYIDTVKVFVIPDTSTRLASMRTGRADWIDEVEGEDARSLIKSNAELKYRTYFPYGYGIGFRQEKTDLPFKDKRVRQALMMATDFDSFKNDFYGGNGEIQVFPVAPNYPNLWVPMKDLPQSVQALYKYNPEGAKKLLAEAGYPNGFKTKMIVENVASRMDPATVFKAMWAKVGVDVELQPRETAVFQNIQTARSWEEMLMFPFYGTSLSLVFAMSGFHGVTLGWSDPVVEDTFNEMQKHVVVDMPGADALYRKMVPYVMEQAFIIPRPTPFTYNLWQPWVKNYYAQRSSIRFWPKYVWIDQDLKEKMTGRR